MDLTALNQTLAHAAGFDPLARSEHALTNLTELSSQLERELKPSQDEAPLDWITRSNPYHLEMAKSLFNSLQSKHVKTASHSARVLLGSSTFATRLGLAAEDRDAIELAALLHDVGKICVPDSILLKPSHLTPDEQAVMQRCRGIGLELVRNCLNDQRVLDLMNNVPAWFDGSRTPASKDQIPLGSRILSILDAFDSMTSEQVYRQPLDPTKALDELHRFAGTQFDPELVRMFGDTGAVDPNALQDQAEHWLNSLAPTRGGILTPAGNEFNGGAGLATDLFQYSLLENIAAAVVFVSPMGKVLYWNRGAERLTGVPGARVRGQRWSPELVHMRTDRGLVLREDDCPIVSACRGMSIERRFQIRNAQGREMAVDVQAMPVRSKEGEIHGAILLAEDASSAVTLENRCRNLNEMASRDALTQVFNRAEFDRQLGDACQEFERHGLTYSLVICDVDHFKKVNDNYGHQAGDEVLKGFARLLERACRGGDLVARYGGEEFVLLYPGCDLVNANRRADAIRRELAEIPQPALSGKPVTASFGVTEIAAGDSPTSMLRRADVALYAAKGKGRNVVVTMVAGQRGDDEGSLKDAAERRDAELIVLEEKYFTSAPVSLMTEKLRGYLAEGNAELAKADGEVIELKLGSGRSLFRRRGDVPMPLVIELRFPKVEVDDPRKARTDVHITVRLTSRRERRREEAGTVAAEQSRKLRMYLGLTDKHE